MLPRRCSNFTASETGRDDRQIDAGELQDDGVKRPIIFNCSDGWGRATRKRGTPELANTANMKRSQKNIRTRDLIPSAPPSGSPRHDGEFRSGAHEYRAPGRADDYDRVNTAIADGSFYQKSGAGTKRSHTPKKGAGIHYMGLASNIGFTPTLRHVNALVELAHREGLHDTRYLHAFMTAGDFRPRFRAASSTNRRLLAEKKVGEIVTPSAATTPWTATTRWTGSKWPTKPSFMAQENLSDPSIPLRNAFQC